MITCYPSVQFTCHIDGDFSSSQTWVFRKTCTVFDLLRCHFKAREIPDAQTRGMHVQFTHSRISSKLVLLRDRGDKARTPKTAIQDIRTRCSRRHPLRVSFFLA